MGILDISLSLTAPAVLLGLVIIFARRGLIREFPFFFAYILYTLLAAALEMSVMYKPTAYFWMYWSTDALSDILALLVLREVFHRIFPPQYSILRRLRWLFPMTAAVMSATALWGTLYHPLGHTLIGRFVSAIYWFDLGIHALQGSILLFAMALTVVFPVSWPRYEFGIVTGFGISASAVVIADLLVLRWGQTYETFFRYGPPIAYFLATLVWLHAFFRPPKPSRHSRMEFNELLAKIEKALVLRRRAVLPPV